MLHNSEQGSHSSEKRQYKVIGKVKEKNDNVMNLVKSVICSSTSHATTQKSQVPPRKNHLKKT